MSSDDEALTDGESTEETMRHPDPAYRMYHKIMIPDDDDNDAAMVIMRETEDGYFWITNVYVKGDLRGRGYATFMINKILDEFGYKDIYLQVQPYGDMPKNEKELKTFYKQFGFTETEVPTILKRRGGGTF
jgi:ribosomal protein S18 acetylase RimI-like enzyme